MFNWKRPKKHRNPKRPGSFDFPRNIRSKCDTPSPTSVSWGFFRFLLGSHRTLKSLIKTSSANLFSESPDSPPSLSATHKSFPPALLLPGIHCLSSSSSHLSISSRTHDRSRERWGRMSLGEWLSSIDIVWHLPVILLTLVFFYISSPARYRFCKEHYRHRSQQSIQLSIECRNLLNKKEAGPPSTIKESSESNQTIDDNDSEKGSGQLKHENTVVRADAGTSKVAALNSSSTAHPGLRSEIIRITEAIVQAVANKDFTTYSRLCDPTITLIGPETCGNIVEGIEFHRYQFEQHGMNNSVGSSSGSGRVQASLLNPHLHTMGEDGATIAYTVLTQYMDRDGMPRTRQTSESRVWHKKVGRWVCVHLHRSGPMEAL